MTNFGKFAAMAVPLLVLAAGCMGDYADRGLGPQCASSLEAAENTLGNSKARGFDGTVLWTRAASLIAAAKTQQAFGEYQNCVQKAIFAKDILTQ